MDFIKKIESIKLIFIFFIIILIFLSSSVVKAVELPALIFVYDDGYKEDLEIVFPVHDKYNVPAVTAVNSDYIGGANWLNKEQLHFLQSKGWEIANHGKKHAALIFNSLTKKAKKGEKEIKVRNANLLELSYDYFIFNKDENLKEKISLQKIETKNGAALVKIKNKLENNYPSEGSYLKLDQASIEEEVIESRLELEEMGLIIDSFVYPYNGYYSLPLELVSKNYKAGRAGYKEGESFPEAFINKKPLEKYRLKAAAVEKNLIREKDIYQLLETTKREKGLLIFYGHSYNDSFKIERIEKIIKYALKNKIKITTFRELFKD